MGGSVTVALTPSCSCVHMQPMPTYRLRRDTDATVRALQDELGRDTGVRPALAEIVAMCVREGARVVRSSSALSIAVGGKVRA